MQYRRNPTNKKEHHHSFYTESMYENRCDISLHLEYIKYVFLHLYYVICVRYYRYETLNAFDFNNINNKVKFLFEN